MKKLSQIVESIWSDIQDRSSGDVIRKEDDVINHFDVYDFYDYIESKYKSKIEYLSIGVFDHVGLYKEADAKDIHIEPYENDMRMYVFYYDTKDISSIKFIFSKSSKWNLDILKKKFNLKPTGEHDDCNDRFEISERDGEITNQMVLNILDTLIDNKDQILKESIWSDIQDRSSGDVVRKEDELKPLDLGDHCNFYFADEDFKVNGKDDFTYDEMKSLKFPNGWRLPKSSEFENTVYNDIDTNTKPHKNIKIIDRIPDRLIIKSKQTGEEVCFELNGNNRVYYWCDDIEKMNWPSVELGWCPGNTDDYYVIGGGRRDVSGRIRLVKDK